MLVLVLVLVSDIGELTLSIDVARDALTPTLEPSDVDEFLAIDLLSLSSEGLLARPSFGKFEYILSIGIHAFHSE